MSEKYFDKFPLITYNNSLVVNITERPVMRDNISKNAYVYYPYDLQNDERPDQISDRQFNDQFMDWLLYLSNGINDPYYDWYMRDDVFNDYILTKYGSVDSIANKIVYYRNNWYQDQNIITSDQYNRLPDIQKSDPLGNLYIESAKKYYEIVMNGKYLVGYRRKRSNDTLHTNKIVSYGIAGNSSFISNEIVRVNFGYQSNTYTTTGTGQVLVSNSSTLTIQHTSGYVDVAPSGYNISFSNSYVYGLQSGSNCTISSVTSLANNISLVETIYWSPVTVYEQEVETNLKNKTIRIIDSGAAQDIAAQLANNLISTV